ncbi:MAG: pyridoxine 5'-phosphate synthase [Flavobacteriales bacterium]|nr:pyridoxine 5'-phosphate synthase [Flavobacteriales bacterium]MCB9449466.1 pyridoxine 5'-phosphate synthase [Flavobacteriales bacterium]
MTKLSVNINKVATLRNARGGNVPDVVQIAVDCQRFGAQGITVHPRPDERHIRYADVHDLRPVVKTEFNIEGYPSELFMELVESVKPEQVTLVPDPPDVLTSNNGWDARSNQELLKDVVSRLQAGGMRVSIFMNAAPEQMEWAAKTGTDRIELYTESYASGYANDPAAAIAPFRLAAQAAADAGLGINAGHDLNLHNLRYFHQHIPNLLEVSIGHALISDALYMGLEKTIQSYLEALR